MREQPFAPRLLVALDQALPFAFIAIIYGEATFAASGLGFSILVASITKDGVQVVSAFLLLSVMFIVLSSVLHWLLKRPSFAPDYFRPATPVYDNGEAGL
jgi:ABC-type nitrate/sulfonate/bicarbonate transport system permease component